MADRAQRTEPPTQRRLEKARQEGQFPAARELVSALQFAVFVALVAAGGGRWFAGLEQTARELFSRPPAAECTAVTVTRLAWQIAARHLGPPALAGMALVAATLLFRLVTTRFGLSLKKLAPDLGRLNPLARLRELPGQNLASLTQAVVLVPLFGWAVYAIARNQLDGFLRLPLAQVASGARLVTGAVMELLWKAAGLFLVFGCADLFRQVRRYRRDLRMSKQEIREEVKESEGNPQMKARIRRLQRERARRRMMKDVPSPRRWWSIPRITRWRSATAWTAWRRRWSWPKARTTWRSGSARRPSSTRCRSSRTRRWRRPSTNRSRSARRSRRTCTARWPRSWPTFSN